MQTSMRNNDTREPVRGFIGEFGSVENLISFNYSLDFFHRYRIAGVSVVSKRQDRLAGNIRQNISEM